MVLWALLSSLLSGCQHSSDCTLGEVKCDNDSAMVCDHVEDGNGGYETWQATSCGSGSCKVDGPNAFCTLSSTPDPSCSDETFYCSGTSLVQCQSGYATATHDCATGVNSPATVTFPGVGKATTYCVDTPPPRYLGFAPTAFCATAPTPDPNCPTQSPGAPYDPTTVCSDNSLLSCFYGYTVSVRSCDVACCGGTP